MKINKKIIISLAVLSILLMILPISASDNLTDVGVGEDYQTDFTEMPVNEINEEENDGIVDNDAVLGNGCSTEIDEEEDIETSLVITDKNVIKEEYLHVQLVDINGTPIQGKTVKVGIVGKIYNCTTNKDGIAKLKIQLSYREYPVTFTFDCDGYKTSEISTKIFVIPSNKTTLTASDTTIYRQIGGNFKTVLKVGNVALASRGIKITIAGKTYTCITNAKGEAVLPIKLSANTYPVTYTFKGEQNLPAVSGSAKVIVKNLQSTSLTVVGGLTFKKGVVSPFVVQLKSGSTPLKNKVVYITVSGKTYYTKTDSNGKAQLPIGLKKGTYPISYKFNRVAPYEGSQGSTKITVVQPIVGKGAIWVNGYSMKSVSFSTLSKNGINNIFLNSYAFTLHGKTNVLNWIKQANNNGLKVHIWMQVFYDGGWISPVNSDGSYKYSLMNSRISSATYYAKLPGVSGIHLDYLRFGGTAYKHKNAAAAINYFTKKCCDEVHKAKPGCVVSAAIMPEPSSNIHYYGQDIPTLSRSLDVLVPMVYKGNYNAGTNWIKTTTAAFVKMSNGAEVWTGLQCYKSDSDISVLGYNALYNDAVAGKNGGAKGIALFRYGLTQFININKIFS